MYIIQRNRISYRTIHYVTLILALAISATAHAGMVSFFESTYSKCPEGWVEVSAAKGRLIRGTTHGANVGKTQGTPIKDQTPPVHQHAFTIGVKLKPEPVVAFDGLNKSLTGSNTLYKASGTSSASDGRLPYMQLLVCEQQSGSPADEAMPKEMVAFFNDQQCPKDWEPYINLNDRFALPIPADAKEGDFNAAVDPWPGGALNHDHPITVLDDKTRGSDETVRISISAQSVVLAKRLWPFRQDKRHGNYIVPQGNYRSAKGSAMAPYINFLVCRKTAGRNRTSQLPGGMCGFITAEHCPDKWLEKRDSMGRFLVAMPAGQYAHSGVAFGSTPLKSREIRKHYHELETTVHLTPVGIAGANGCCAHNYARSGKYKMRGKTVSSATSLRYVQMRHCFIPHRASPDAGGKPIKQ